jgi:hypothetical protein
MTAKRKPKADDPAQFARFKEAAKEVGLEKTGDALERAFSRVVPEKRARKAS